MPAILSDSQIARRGERWMFLSLAITLLLLALWWYSMTEAAPDRGSAAGARPVRIQTRGGAPSQTGGSPGDARTGASGQEHARTGGSAGDAGTAAHGTASPEPTPEGHFHPRFEKKTVPARPDTEEAVLTDGQVLEW
ncbi:MAG: hypothetical protein HY319_16600 [Armatimonadetes bacterium]|nr:hypothetical protein [Armatimonadota bacterium]